MNSRKKALSVFFKVAILVCAFTFIFHKLNNNTNLQNFNKLIAGISLTELNIILGGLFVLMLLNWVLEAVKWQFLVKGIQKISLWKAIESVFCGLTIAVFTPNRIGEYGGRVFFLLPKRRILGIVAMAVGAVGQMVITNVLGALALLWFIVQFLPIGVPVKFGITLFVAFFCAFFLLFYFNIRWMGSLLIKISFLRRFTRFVKILARYSPQELRSVFLYCTARFVVFTSQYCLVINMLIPEMPILPMVMMVFILFFIQSALPSLDLLDVGVRTMTATYFFSFITHQEIAIMASTACIWLVNLIIPAILGSVFVFKLNFFGTNNH